MFFSQFLIFCYYFFLFFSSTSTNV